MMAHKRPREGDGDPSVIEDIVGDGDDDDDCDGDDDGDDDGSAPGNTLVSLFGMDNIHEIEDGNTTFARGGFGELTIALKSRSQKQSPSSSSSSSNSNSNSNCSSGQNYLYSFVAVKTIHNAIANGGNGGNNRFGGFGRSQQQQQDKKQQLSTEVLNEVLALKLLQPHPNIVPLVAVYPAGNHGALSLVFDYCPMDLREVLEVRRRTFRQPLHFRFLRTICRDVFGALAHCHDNGILHRDLKPGNLLVSSKGVIRLCDFGLAKPFLSFDTKEIEKSPVDSAANTNNDKGLCTLYYRPPEVLLGGPSEYPSVDSWSAGAVLAELITGRPLWKGRNVIGQLSLVFGSLGTPNETTWPSVRTLPDYGKLNFGDKPPQRWEDNLARAAESPLLVDLVSKLLALNPVERLTAREALDHGWLLREQKQAAETTSSVVEDNSHRNLRDELILPTNLRIPTLLFPENRALAGKLGLGIAESRRFLLSSSKGVGNHWQGPTLVPLKLCD